MYFTVSRHAMWGFKVSFVKNEKRLVKSMKYKIFIENGIGSSVGTVVNSLKGNQNVVSAATSVVNAASSFAGVVKRDKKSKKTKK